jgi:hypothetical protein
MADEFFKQIAEIEEPPAESGASDRLPGSAYPRGTSQCKKSRDTKRHSPSERGRGSQGRSAVRSGLRERPAPDRAAGTGTEEPAEAELPVKPPTVVQAPSNSRQRAYAIAGVALGLVGATFVMASAIGTRHHDGAPHVAVETFAKQASAAHGHRLARVRLAREESAARAKRFDRRATLSGDETGDAPIVTGARVPAPSVVGTSESCSFERP